MLAAANAKNLLKKLNLSSISDIDIEDICFAENLYIKTEDNLNCEGIIVFNNKMGIITLDRKIDNVAQKRFIIAHEMGHFYNESTNADEANIFYNCTSVNFYGKAGISKIKNEENASQFAAELLMPETLVRNYCNHKKFNFEVIRELSKIFNVSLSAISIRIINLDIYPIAIVMTKEKEVKWTAISLGFKYKFIPIGMKVNSLSYAFDYYNNKPIPEFEDIPAEAWFNKDYSFRDKNERIMEMVIPMPNYNSAMVILWE